MTNPVLTASGFTEMGNLKLFGTIFLVVFAIGTGLAAYNTILEIKINRRDLQ